MKKMRWAFLSGIFLVLFFAGARVSAGAEAAAGNGVSLDFGGYYKMLAGSIDVPLGGVYADYLNRLRLSLDAGFGPAVRARVEYDLELHLGDFSDSAYSRLFRRVEAEPYWATGEVIHDDDDFFLEHSLYRGYLQVSLPAADLKIGRQGIDWGFGRAWNPTNPFFPVNPLFIEKEEMAGTDAVTLLLPIGQTVSVELLAAGRPGLDQPALAGRGRGNFRQTDYALTLYEDGELTLAGLDVSRTIAQAEVHGAVALADGPDSDYNSFTAGIDYGFPGTTLKAGLEYFYNGAGERDEKRYDFLKLLSGDLQFAGRDYLFGGLDFEVNPNLRFQGCVVSNLNDQGLFINPVLIYSAGEASSLSLGWAGFQAGKGDEFAFYPDIWYFQFQRFF
ncbi:MAG TPA: hypothetical protein PKN80_07095 [bacterium]|nr:hypothetical protein [bacterium]HNS49218.1 hypothetical protein [bacterium]